MTSLHDKVCEEQKLTIWNRRSNIERARSKKMQELMKEYDETVYYPAKKALVRECFLEGHGNGKFHDNGLGWTWMYCGKCGGRYQIQSHDGERRPDDGDWDND